jgi:Holliday junction resolvasome RuvABC endonuclease subunit
MDKKEIILGLDCSTTSTGWSIFDNKGLAAYGVIKPDGEDWRDRLVHQAPKLKGIIEKYQPTKIIMEDVPLNGKGGLKILVVLGAVQGMILGIASSYGIPIKFITPNEWRSKVGLFDGKRESTKREEMKQKSIELANKEFGLDLKWFSKSSKFNQDDISDSILIAYSYFINT